MKKFISLLLIFVLLCSCTKTKEFTVEGKLENYSVYVDELNRIMHKYGYGSLRPQWTSYSFTIEFDADDSFIEVYLSEGDFTITCYLTKMTKKNVLPSEIDTAFLADVINLFGKITITKEEIDEFVAAPDSKYPFDLGNDYEGEEDWGEETYDVYQDYLSAKEKYFEVEGADKSANTLSLMVDKDYLGSLDFTGNLKTNEFQNIVNLKGIIEDYDYENWDYTYNEEYQFRISGYSAVGISFYSNPSQDVYLEPYDYEFSLAYDNELQNAEEAYKSINARFFVEMANVLAKDKLTLAQLQEFIKDDSDKYKYEDAYDEEYVLISKQYSRIGDTANSLSYYLSTDFYEYLLFSNYLFDSSDETFE